MGPKNGLAMYACATEPTVRVDSLTYFAASTFWRAGAISWHDKDRTEDRIALGPYQELLRQFLLDEASFPAHCTLWIFVSNAASPHLAAAFPFGNRVLDFRAWRFWVPGIQFILLVGQQVPAAIRVGCAVYAPDRYVMLTDDFESDLVDVMRKKIATVTPTRGLG
ncbi:MAG: hypothetical protein ACKVPX_07205 [Myxococcaceae bacterium]